MPSSVLSLPSFTWDDVRRQDMGGLWIVVDDLVYDLGRFSVRHPGGKAVLSHLAGSNAKVGHIIIIIRVKF